MQYKNKNKKEELNVVRRNRRRRIVNPSNPQVVNDDYDTYRQTSRRNQKYLNLIY